MPTKMLATPLQRRFHELTSTDKQLIDAEPDREVTEKLNAPGDGSALHL